MTTEKEKYRQLCSTEKSIPVFLQDWWLDAVCGNSWDVVLIEENNVIKAAWPYQLKKNKGFTLLNMPSLTSSWGPWIHYPEGQKYASRLSFEHQVITDLLAKLPKFHYFNQRFRHSLTNGLPFYWKGFTLNTRYTYLLDDLRDSKQVWDNFNSSTRSQIRKAEKAVTVVEGDDITKLYLFTQQLFERQGSKVPYSETFLRKLDAACQQHGCRKIFLAVDEQQRVHAALYLVWDQHSAYYLAGGTDADAAGGAFSLLMWKAIEHASTVSACFDFEGSMLESVERFFRSFGARQAPYLHVQKVDSKMLKIARSVGLFK